MENLTCENCKQPFTLSDEDLALYAKFEVPTQQFCFDCRMQQLMMWRNERTLYNRKDAFGKDVISIFSPESPYTIYNSNDWWKDNWDPLQFGQEYDFSRSFFEQYDELLKKVPLISLFNQQAVNSPYCNHAEDSKDCHLIFGSIWNEGVLFSRGAIKSKDSLDILQGENLELCYNVINCEDCFNVNNSQQSTHCNDSQFLYYCQNCSDCIGCVNLKNKTFCIFNKQYTEAEYKKRVAELRLDTRKGREDFAQKFQEFVLQFPHQFAHLVNTENVVGDHVSGAKDCYYCFSIFQDTENCRYCAHGGAQMRDSIDNYGVGACELVYKSVDTGIKVSNARCVIVGRGGYNNTYTFYCHNSNNIFGCIGLRNKEYCILNRQYTKAEYETMIAKIKQHMMDMPYVDKLGRKFFFGDFFPSEISPFSYNETIAQEYYPITKQIAEKQGFSWKDETKKNHTATKRGSELPEKISEVSETALNDVIGCEHGGTCEEQCTGAFKLTAQELKFYKKKNLPLPILCPNCRHYSRRAKQNPMKLWHRKCMCDNKVYANTTAHWHKNSACTNEFETSYNPDRKEIVYCKDCFNSEVA